MSHSSAPQHVPKSISLLWCLIRWVVVPTGAGWGTQGSDGEAVGTAACTVRALPKGVRLS